MGISKTKIKNIMIMLFFVVVVFSTVTVENKTSLCRGNPIGAKVRLGFNWTITQTQCWPVYKSNCILTYRR